METGSEPDGSQDSDLSPMHSVMSIGRLLITKLGWKRASTKSSLEVCLHPLASVDETILWGSEG